MYCTRDLNIPRTSYSDNTDETVEEQCKRKRCLLYAKQKFISDIHPSLEFSQPAWEVWYRTEVFLDLYRTREHVERRRKSVIDDQDPQDPRAGS